MKCSILRKEGKKKVICQKSFGIVQSKESRELDRYANVD